MQPPGRIEDQRIIAIEFGIPVRRRTNIHRILIGARIEDRNTKLPANGFQLLDRRRAIDVGRHQQRIALFLAQLECQLATGRGFTGALQATKNNRHRWPCRQVEAIVDPLAHQPPKLFTHDLDDLLCGRETFQDLLSDRPLADGGDKILDDAKIDISLQEDQSDLAKGVLYIIFSQPAVATELLENRVEFFRQIVKHAGPGLRTSPVAKCGL